MKQPGGVFANCISVGGSHSEHSSILERRRSFHHRGCLTGTGQDRDDGTGAGAAGGNAIDPMPLRGEFKAWLPAGINDARRTKRATPGVVRATGRISAHQQPVIRPVRQRAQRRLDRPAERWAHDERPGNWAPGDVDR